MTKFVFKEMMSELGNKVSKLFLCFSNFDEEKAGAQASCENPPRFSFELSCSFITLSIIFFIPECFEGEVFLNKALCDEKIH